MIIKTPLFYTLQAIDDYHELTIENGKGDWAVYTSKLLSSSSFNQINFAIYPNPVKDILQVSNSSNQPVTAAIYAINGKLLHTQTIEHNNTSIDVKSLNQGLYFVIFESETGEMVSKKFIKR